MQISKPSFSFCVGRKLRHSPTAYCQKIRTYKHKPFSDARSVVSSARFSQPVLLPGLGKITLDKCNLGVCPSPYYLSGYIHIEARNPDAEVITADGVFINNNAVIIAERTRISIGKNMLIGTEFTVYDSDFHELHSERRMSGNHATASVTIGANVFIGSRVTVLKGVVIGDNSVIANGSIVAKDVPANVVAGGIPTKVIRTI